MKRSKIIRFTVTPKEKETIELLAKQHSIPVASFIRYNILKLQYTQLLNQTFSGCVDTGE